VDLVDAAVDIEVDVIAGVDVDLSVSVDMNVNVDVYMFEVLELFHVPELELAAAGPSSKSIASIKATTCSSSSLISVSILASCPLGMATLVDPEF